MLSLINKHLKYNNIHKLQVLKTNHKLLILKLNSSRILLQLSNNSSKVIYRKCFKTEWSNSKSNKIHQAFKPNNHKCRWFRIMASLLPQLCRPKSNSNNNNSNKWVWDLQCNSPSKIWTVMVFPHFLNKLVIHNKWLEVLGILMITLR